MTNCAVGIDGSWHTRGSGHSYKSNTACVIAVDLISGGVCSYACMQKNGGKCQHYRRTHNCAEVPADMREAHDCRENNHGLSSKAMKYRGAVMVCCCAVARRRADRHANGETSRQQLHVKLGAWVHAK